MLLCCWLLALPARSQSPNWQWAAQSNGSGVGQLKSMAVDGAGNSYEVGFFTGAIQFGATSLVSQGRSDVFVAKLSPGGSWEWAVAAGSADSDNATGIVIDATGRIFVSGSFSSQARFGASVLTSQGDMDVFVAQISPLGKWQWATAAGGPGQDRASALAVGSAGDLVVGGRFTDTVAFGTSQLVSKGSSDAFVARLTRTGTWQWGIGAGGEENDEVSALAVNAAGDIYATGYFSNTVAFGSNLLTGQGMDDAFVAKLSSGGRWQWATAATATNTAYGKGLAADPAGGVFVTGSFWGMAQFGPTKLNSNASDDGFVAKLDDTGAWQWVAPLASDYLESIVGIALDKTGRIYIAGTFSRSIQGGAFRLSSRGQQDVFVGYISRQGNWLGLTAGGGSGTDETNAMALTPGGNVFVGGGFSKQAMFGATQLQSGTAATQVCVGRAAVGPQP
ncbi:hypothetical protein Q5H93_05040 [Hymenobacter sp. ASUV-10]|uniref:Uncharacterized protein n=1 Tax=Hymenobacter aranciens TaxID=3063996 RepID=A0ABT9B8Q0_9BACT|nr:hypothetical protein [Hymenobacter sp. ASUV-10]MDO7874089.1 hypothetical protein [Hymenobacter sp. ASUV-10]